MAELVANLGVTHNPLFWRFLPPPDGARAPGEAGAADAGDELRPVAEHYRRFRERLAAARPDALLVVGTDHFAQLFTDNMPAFMVGKHPAPPGIFHNEAREFGFAPVRLRGDPELAAALLEAGLDRHFDLSFSDEYRLDHAFVQPLLYLWPDLDVPVVPLFTNCFAPPLPRPARFLALGEALAAIVAELPAGLRLAVVTSGHLATEVGGPRQFAGSPDPEWDRAAVGWVRRGATAEAVASCGYADLAKAGNVTHQFMNFLVGMGLAGGRGAALAEGVPSRFATAPFFDWGAP